MVTFRFMVTDLKKYSITYPNMKTEDRERLQPILMPITKRQKIITPAIDMDRKSMRCSGLNKSYDDDQDESETIHLRCLEPAHSGSHGELGEHYVIGQPRTCNSATTHRAQAVARNECSEHSFRAHAPFCAQRPCPKTRRCDGVRVKPFERKEVRPGLNARFLAGARACMTPEMKRRAPL
jgi:hypothetical protein